MTGGRDGGNFDAAPLLYPPWITREKAGYAVEQDYPDVLSAREAWFEDQVDPEPKQLVFIDETWTATNMTRSHGRCRCLLALNESEP